MYYDVRDVDLTNKEIQFLKDVLNGYNPDKRQVIAPLVEQDLVRLTANGIVEVTSRGVRYLEILKKKSRERILWSVVIPIAVALITAYITTKLSLQ